VNSTLNFTRKTDIARIAYLNVFCFCEPNPCASNGNPFKVNVNEFSRSSVPRMSCIFVLTIATIFARDLRQQHPVMHKCNSTLNTLSSIASLSLVMRLYHIFTIPGAKNIVLDTEVR